MQGSCFIFALTQAPRALRWPILLALLVAASSLCAADKPFFFVQLTDPQMGMQTGNRDFAQETASFEFVAATINRLKPAFVVITGDLVNKTGDQAQIREYKRIKAEIDPSIALYEVAGNHDVGNTPTPESIAAYTNQFGPDHYTFRYENLVGIVLDSSLIQSPQKAPELESAQERWLASALQKAKDDGAKEIMVFQHHSWFLKSSDEPDQYFNLPLAQRAKYLPLLKQYGVRFAFCGHYHRNADAHDGGLEVVTSAPVGMPIGHAQSGIQVVIVRDGKVEHRFYDFGEIPNHIDLARAKKS